MLINGENHVDDVESLVLQYNRYNEVIDIVNNEMYRLKGIKNKLIEIMQNAKGKQIILFL